jgi:copper(I)-binding protein
MHKAFLVLPALAFVAACNKAPELGVDKAWVQLSPVRTNPSVAYFTVHGGPQDNNLIQVSSPVAIKSEMHESMSQDGVMKMAPLQSVPIPAKGEVKFAPGGKHVMFWYVNPGITPGKTMTLVFSFSNGDSIQVEAPTQALGAPPPK